jgi:hypothetical protein
LNTNAEFQALPLVEPIAYGRSLAGTSRVAVSQDRATATYTPAAAAICASRWRRDPGSPSHAIIASAGSAITDSSSLTSNASPSAAAAPTSQLVRPVSHARISNSRASTIKAIITASIVSLRDVMTSTGRTAIASAAATPAADPHSRRTHAYSKTTVAVPANASGSFSVVEEKPSSFTLITCSQRSIGDLSMETLPPGSKAPKKKMCSDSVMLRTAAS